MADDGDRPADDSSTPAGAAGSDRKSATAVAFGDSAEGYRRSEVHREGEDLDRLAGWCADAERALDVATGAGHTAGAVVRAGVATVVALDAAPAMLETAVDSFPAVRPAVGDAERLPFADASFDAVACRIAAHHFPDPLAFVDEAARVLRPGGTLAFEDLVVPEDRALATFLNELERLRDPTHVESRALSTWRGWFEAAGFAVEETVRLRKRLAFEPWLERSGALDEAGAERVRRHLLDAPPAALAAFDVEFADDEVVSFASPKGLVRAVRVS